MSKAEIEYIVTDALYAEKLIKNVNNYISQGWEPLGGVAVTGEFYGTTIYAQALVREKPLMPSQM